jgi:hypothetical protein
MRSHSRQSEGEKGWRHGAPPSHRVGQRLSGRPAPDSYKAATFALPSFVINAA